MYQGALDWTMDMFTVVTPLKRIRAIRDPVMMDEVAV